MFGLLIVVVVVLVFLLLAHQAVGCPPPPRFDSFSYREEVEAQLAAKLRACDPTFEGTNHTKEHVPILMFGPKINPRFIGRRETLADIGQTIAKLLNIPPLDNGVSFL